MIVALEKVVILLCFILPNVLVLDQFLALMVADVLVLEVLVAVVFALIVMGDLMRTQEEQQV
jgi:hypothetical protein